MMRGLKSFVLCLMVSACAGELPPEFSTALSGGEAARNMEARQFVENVRRRFGSDAILSIGSRNPEGYDFTPVVRRFADRAAVAYTNRRPDFIVVYELKEVDGSWTGPNILNFVLTTSLVRTSSANHGSEIVATTSYRGRCRELGPRYPISCRTQLDKFAEAALYSLKMSERTRL